MRKIVGLIVILIIFSAVGFFLLLKRPQKQELTWEVLSPFKSVNGPLEKSKEKENNGPLGKPINIMLLGIDRRSRYEAYRTDIMILLTVDWEKNKVIMTSIPRDLWYQGQRLNAVFLGNGWDEFKAAIQEITGQEPSRYILTDFADFSWIIDAMGGVPVQVERTFTDFQYPVDETFEYQTVNFVQGAEKLTGERALIFARSRKGDNGEGSDWARMRRQHLILKGMVEAVQQPGSLFNPMVVENAFNTVTQGKMDTNMQLSDAVYLWDFYKDRDDYEVTSLFLDTEYLYSPPMEDYGGAWVLAPTTGSYEEFQRVFSNELNGIEEEKEEPAFN